MAYRPVHAEALVQVARSLDAGQQAGARREAEQLYFQALDTAEADRHDELAAAIWYQLVWLAREMDSDTRQAHGWLRRYAAAVARIGNNDIDQARVHYLLGELYNRDSRFAEAADEENRAITAMPDTAEHQIELGRYYDARAKSLVPLDRVDEALALHEHALRIERSALGAAHPDVIELELNYCLALKSQGEYERARTGLEAALAHMAPAARDASLDGGLVHTVLSEVLYYQNKLDDAVAHGRAARAIYARAGAPNHRRAEAEIAIANAELKRKHFGDALAGYQRALELRRPHLADDNYQLGVNEGSVAEAMVGLARFDEAKVHLHEAERILARGSAYNRETRAWILTLTGEVQLGEHQLAAAAAVFEQALPLFEAAPDPGNQAIATWGLARALRGLRSRSGARPSARGEGACAVRGARVGTSQPERRGAVPRGDSTMTNKTTGSSIGASGAESAAAASHAVAIRHRLAEARTLELDGCIEASLVIADEACTRARLVADRPVLAEALVHVARALDGRQTASARREAERRYHEALEIAADTGQDELAAGIWNRLVLLAIEMDSGTQQARQWWASKAVAVSRLDRTTCNDGVYHDSRLHHLLCEIYYREGKYCDAERAARQALAAIAGPAELTAEQERLRRRERSRYDDALAKSLEAQGKLDEAVEMHAAALRCAEAALGASHPDVIKLRINLGLAQKKQGKLDAARVTLHGALADMRDSSRNFSLDAGTLHSCLSDLYYELGDLDDASLHAHLAQQIYDRVEAPDHRRAEACASAGNAELKRKNFSEALASYQRARELRRPNLCGDHYQIGINEGSLAEALVGLRRYDEALVHVCEARRILALDPAQHAACQGWILAVHGEVLVGKNQPRAAIPLLEQALGRFAEAPDRHNEAIAAWALARALQALGDDPDRVRTLAARARGLFTALGAPEADNLAAVERFLAPVAA